MEKMRAMDPNDERIRKFHRALMKYSKLDPDGTAEKSGDYGSFATADVEKFARTETVESGPYHARPKPKYPELIDIMLDDHGKINPKSFGKTLSNMDGKVRDGVCVEVFFDKKRGNRFRLRKEIIVKDADGKDVKKYEYHALDIAKFAADEIAAAQERNGPL
jgi:hypothetical protein